MKSARVSGAPTQAQKQRDAGQSKGRDLGGSKVFWSLLEKAFQGEERFGGQGETETPNLYWI